MSGKLNAYANELEYSKLKIQFLEEKLRLQRIAEYGPGSEKLSNLQLELLEFEPGVSSTEVAAESERGALPPTAEKKKRCKHPGRQILPADLSRVERVIACTPEQCICGGCGADTKVIGYEVSEVLDVKPAEYFVQVTKREKRACKKCEEQGVAMAPLPVRIIAKSLVWDRIIVDTIAGKYADHHPLFRQGVIFLRDAGIDSSRATMCGWVMTVGELPAPVVGAMRRDLLAGSYIQADETTVDVQTHDRRGKNHQAYLWQYGTPGGATIFDFQMGRGREGPARFLDKFEGVLQVVGSMSFDPCGRCEIGDLLNGLVVKSWQDLVQVVANRDPEPAAALNHGDDRGHTRSGLLAADLDPVFSAQRYAAHGIFRQVVAQFQFRIFEEARQFLP